VEHEDNITHLEVTLAELQAKVSQVWTHCPGECRDVAVSTEDDSHHKSFRNVCIQTDRETFIKSPYREVTGNPCTSPQQHKGSPKKLDLRSISLSLAGQRDDSLSSSSSPLTSEQTPPPGDSPPLSEKQVAASQITLPAKQDSCSPPPPPPLPCLSPAV